MSIKSSRKKEANTAAHCLLTPFALAVDTVITVFFRLFKRRKALLSSILEVVMVITIIPLASAPICTAESYNHTYTGMQGCLTLASGSYLLDRATITGTAGQNGIAVAAGGKCHNLYQGDCHRKSRHSVSFGGRRKSWNSCPAGCSAYSEKIRWCIHGCS